VEPSASAAAFSVEFFILTMDDLLFRNLEGGVFECI